jgi:cytolysin-activating lysine-acyltransferase
MTNASEETKPTPEKAGKNGASAEATHPDPEIAKKISDLRSTLRENFGKVVMAMMMMPRYRTQMLGDLQHLVLDPMLQDRVAMAYPSKQDNAIAPDMAGFAIWASVSEEVDQRIRDQIAQGVFPVRLRNEDWNSGDINWLLDVIAAKPETIATVIANFRQVVKDGELRLHPLVSRMVDPETLKKMGARRASETSDESDAD